ncbi:hypothetical protein L917_10040, partial [Phytophthora nicotianae]
LVVNKKLREFVGRLVEDVECLHVSTQPAEPSDELSPPTVNAVLGL